MKIWNLAIRQPVFMSMILLAGIVLGIYSYFRMPVDLFPNVEFPVVVVNTIYPGAGPEEIEDQVTSALEDELATLSGIDTVQSTSSEGVSTIILQFDLDVPVDRASQDARERVNNLRNQLPEGIQEPVIATFDPNDIPILSFGVADRTGTLTPLELRSLVEEKVQAPLETVPGVSAVEVSGGQIREIQVNLDMRALEARRIAPQQIVAALQSENINLPGGTVASAERELLLRTPANFETLEDVGNVVVSQQMARGGATVYLRDVAEVVDGLEQRDSISRLNGEEAVIVTLRKQSASNTPAIADDAKEMLDEIREANPDLDIALLTDQSVDIENSTEGALDDLLWGSLLASLVMFFFFRDLRNTFVTIAGLPVIMIATVFFMDTLGIGLNQISLLALALVVGLVIDDAIVVRENILRWVEKGYSPRQAASLGTAEVVLPVLATGATILAVFLPVAYATGIIGRFFREFGLTVSLAILVSTFEALTMAPMLSAYLFRPKRKGIDDDPEAEADVDLDSLDPSKEPHFEDEESHGWLARVYGSMLNWTLRHKVITILISIAIMVASFASVALIEVGFLPATNSYDFSVLMRMPAGTPLSVTEQEALRVEAILRSHPAVSHVLTDIGNIGAPEEASFTVVLADNTSRTVTARSVSAELRGPLAKVPGLRFSIGDGGFGATSDVQIEVVGLQGTEYTVLDDEAQALADRIRAMPGLVDVDVSYKPGRPELQLVIDREMASQLGLSAAQIASTVRLMVNGSRVSTFRGEGTEAEILVRLQESSRATEDDILNMNLVTPAGGLTPLRSVVRIENAVGPSRIQRNDRRPLITVSANVVGRSIPSVNTEINALIASVQPRPEGSRPAGVDVRQGGDFESQGEAMLSLLLAQLLGVIFIYMVLASQFSSLVQPILIMLALPLAVIGAILGLVVTGSSLDMMAMIGFIMLMGLVTKNSILLVDFANRKRREGASATAAMAAAGPIRLRPVLMTSLSLILAMVPVALALSPGGEFRRTMAIAIMGGMITSTFLTLIVVPVFYASVVGIQDRITAWNKARRAAKRQQRAAVQQPQPQPQAQPQMHLAQQQPEPHLQLQPAAAGAESTAGAAANGAPRREPTRRGNFFIRAMRPARRPAAEGNGSGNGDSITATRSPLPQQE